MWHAYRLVEEHDSSSVLELLRVVLGLDIA